MITTSRQVWNEGRTVGLSAYEEYLRHFYEQQNPDSDPNNPNAEQPANEREWLASSLASGASMICKISKAEVAKQGPQSIDIPFPAKSHLAAANSIDCFLFHPGEGFYPADSPHWATRITKYSPLISNTSASHPSGTVTSGWPKEADKEYNSKQKDILISYMRLTDGVVLQPGTWSTSSVGNPASDFTPDITKPPVLRLQFLDSLKEDLEILLVGFTDGYVLQGISGMDTCLQTVDPASGDFIGPAVFPWAAKVNIIAPTSALYYFITTNYKRSTPKTYNPYVVTDRPVIDMGGKNETTDGKRNFDPGHYYTAHDQNARKDTKVHEFSPTDMGQAVLTTMETIGSSSYSYPPCLYGTKVNVVGDNFLNPLDTAAPGNAKFFDSVSDSEDQKHINDYENTFPGTFGFTRDEEGQLKTVDENGTITNIGGEMSIKDIKYTLYGIDSSDPEVTAKMFKTQVGKGTGYMLAMSSNMTTDKSNPTQWKITCGQSQVVDGTFSVGTNTGLKTGGTSFEKGLKGVKSFTPLGSNINWAYLLYMLANDVTMDILGDNLRLLKEGLNNPKFPYVQFNNGLRLYISATQPTDTDVPVGSIGIGWMES